MRPWSLSNSNGHSGHFDRATILFGIQYGAVVMMFILNLFSDKVIYIFFTCSILKPRVHFLFFHSHVIKLLVYFPPHFRNPYFTIPSWKSCPNPALKFRRLSPPDSSTLGPTLFCGKVTLTAFIGLGRLEINLLFCHLYRLQKPPGTARHVGRRPQIGFPRRRPRVWPQFRGLGWKGISHLGYLHSVYSGYLNSGYLHSKGLLLK